MARRTFFSFHYKPDISRAWIVRNSWVTKSGREDAGFFDSSVFESKQRAGDDVLKRFLREGLDNTSVTCVLVGAETTLRRWVRYELFQSFMRGNGILAGRIHSLADFDQKTCAKGGNPLDDIAFVIDGDHIRFKEYMTTGWQFARDVGPMPLNEVVYDLGSRTNHTFSSLFSTYDYVQQDGYKNMGSWIESAASAAGH